MPAQIELPPPDDSLHDVGPDTDWLGRARRQRELLEHWGFTPDSDLLDIGCGIGRLAYELSTWLEGGSYTGFDISEPAIDWLQRHYQPVVPNFRFDLIDVANGRYRPDGAESAERFVFPYDDDRFDFACSFAVFMHMRLEEIANYFRQVARVLRPGGRGLLTMTAITAEDRARPELPRLGERPWVVLGDGVYAKRPDKPTFGLGFDYELLERTIGESGLELVDFSDGTWRHPLMFDAPKDKVGGDLFVVTPA